MIATVETYTATLPDGTIVAGAPFYDWTPEELHAIAVREKIAPSSWAERYRVLGEYSEEKGPMRLRRTPYAQGMLDALSDPWVERAVICKSAQIGGTEIGISAIGYFCHQEPCPIMLILADEDTARYMSRERIQPMFRESADLRSLPDKSLMDDRRNAVFKRFIYRDRMGVIGRETRVKADSPCYLRRNRQTGLFVDDKRRFADFSLRSSGQKPFTTAKSFFCRRRRLSMAISQPN